MKFKMVHVNITQKQYLCVILTILASGSVCRNIWGELTCIIYFVICWWLYCSTNKLKKVVRKGNLGILGILCMFYGFNFLIHMNDGPSLGAYIAFSMSFSATFLLASSVSFSVFEKQYIDVMKVITACSLIMHGLGYITPIASFARMFAGSNTAKIFLLHNYYAFSEGRNSGMFTEPGLYVVFLAIGIIFVLGQNEISNKRRDLLVALFSCGILSTLSTTGYLILMILLVLFGIHLYKRNNKSIVKFLVIIAVVPLIMIGINFIYNSESFYNKFVLHQGSYSVRYDDIFSSLNILSHNWNFGLGINTTKMAETYLAYGHATNSVGILATAVYMGGWYILFYLLTFAMQTIHQVKLALPFLCILFILACSQSILQYPICYLFLFRFCETMKEKDIDCCQHTEKIGGS